MIKAKQRKRKREMDNEIKSPSRIFHASHVTKQVWSDATIKSETDIITAFDYNVLYGAYLQEKHKNEKLWGDILAQRNLIKDYIMEVARLNRSLEKKAKQLKRGREKIQALRKLVINSGVENE